MSNKNELYRALAHINDAWAILENISDIGLEDEINALAKVHKSLEEIKNGTQS